MSDLHLLNISAAGMKAAQAAYKQKCSLIMERAFQRSFDVRQSMLTWLTERFRKSADPASLLHEAPLYTVGRYLGFSPLDIPPEIQERATKLARDEGWDRLS